MASVFLSYDRDDADKARPIAAALERAGHSVWWDKQISGGSQFSKEIEQALDKADVVVVLWTNHSIESPWVRDEAGAGRDKGRLVPLSLEGTLPPLGFRQFHSIDLGGWRGRGKVPHSGEILAAIERQVTAPGIPDPVAKSPAQRRHHGPSLNMWALIAVTIAMFFVIVGLLIGRPWERKAPAPPTVAVRAADGSTLSKQMTRDLVVNLAALPANSAGKLRILDAGATNGADLIFEASAGADPQRPRGDLTLKRSGDNSILWSRSFAPESRNRGDLEQQLAFTSGKVLECAVEALGSSYVKLSRETLGRYLAGCGRLGEDYGNDTQQVAQIFREVVDKAPHFKDAWAKLLIAESQSYGVIESNEWRAPLEAHIAAAEKIDPNLPEIAIAQFSLLRPGDFVGRGRLIDEAVRRGPESPYVLNLRSTFLQTVGRTNEGIQDAQHAAALDPLSPAMRNAYILALAYGGRVDDAQAELRAAEKIWPGASTLADARFRLNLRYGDPKIAYEMMPKMGDALNPMNQSFLKARMEPSAKNAQEAVAIARSFAEKYPALGFYAQTAAAFGHEDELFDVLLHWRRADLATEVSEVLFRPALHKFRHDARFMQVAARVGLVRFWQKTDDWPDFCFEADLPYDCKKEAAKLNA